MTMGDKPSILDPPIRIRKMRPDDTALGMRLKGEAGWNQCASDWKAYLQIEPDGCFIAELDGRAVGTATAIPYEDRLGWIGMVLVDTDARRKGVGTRLVAETIAYLESVACRCQKLDATEAGALVYEKMGFHIEYEVQRWQRSGKDDSEKRAFPS